MKPSVYEGDKEYIFVSYAHKDSSAIFPILNYMDNSGLRIWYDDGIAPGSEWPENIAQHLDKANVFLVFVSPNSMESANCRREITFALSRQIKFLSIVITETKLPLGMELQISAQQSIIRYNYRTEDEFLNKIVTSEILNECKNKSVEEDNANLQPASTISVSDNSISTHNTAIPDSNYHNSEEVRNPDINPINLAPTSIKKKPTKLVVGLIFSLVALLILTKLITKVFTGNRETDALEYHVSEMNRISVSDVSNGIPIGYTLEYIDKFELTENIKKQDDAICTYDGTHYTLYSVNGMALPDKYCSVKSIGYGCYIVQNDNEEMSSVGLVSANGTELIPCEAQSIECVCDKDGIRNGRFLLVRYVIGQTYNLDDYIYFDGDTSTPREGDTLYKGYIRLYDLKNQQFVSDITFNNSDLNDYKTCGDHIWIINKDDSACLIDDQGHQIVALADAYGMEVGNGYYIIKDGESMDVYDEYGNFHFSTGNGKLYAFDSTSGLILCYSNGSYTLMDINGEEVVPNDFSNLYWESYGLIYGKKDNLSLVYRITGDLIVSCDGSVVKIESAPFVQASKDGNSILIGCNGVVESDYKNTSLHANLVFVNESNALNVLEGDYSISLDGEEVIPLCAGLGAVKSSSTGKYGVVDFLTGETLIEYEYAQIEYVNGYIFARSMNTWTTYSVTTLYT